MHKGIGEVFYNAVQQFWDLGLVLKFLALVNPCAQQRGSLSSLSGGKKKEKKEKKEKNQKFWGEQKLSWRVQMRQK